MLLLTRVAWRNLWRHRRRTLITAGAMAVGAALCMATLTFQGGMFASLFDVMVVQQLGHVQVHDPDYPSTRRLNDTLPDASALVGRIEAQPGTVAVSSRMNGFALLGTESKSAGVVLVGVDPARERAIGPIGDRIVTGVFLPDAPNGSTTLGKDLAEELKVTVGDTVVAVTQAADGSLGNTLLTIVGIHRTGNAQLDRMGAYVHLAELQELLVLPDQVHAITVVTAEERRIGDYVDRLRAEIGSDTIQVQPWWEASPQAAQLMGMRDFGAFVLMGIVFGAAAFGVLNTMMMSVFERTRELGVLKALGLRPIRMVQLIVIESVLLAAVSLTIGLTLGGLLDLYLVVYGFDLSGTSEGGFSFAGVMLDPVVKGKVEPLQLVYIVGSVFVVTVLASLWPAIRAARLQPVVAMRAE